MKIKPFTYRSALLFSLGISLLLNILFLISFLYGRDAVLPPEGERMRPGLTVSGTLLHIFCNFLVSFILYLLNFKWAKIRLQNQDKDNNWVFWLNIPITFVVTAIISYLFSTILIKIGDYGPHPEHFVRGSMARDFFISMIVLFSTQLMYLSHKQQQTALEYKALLSENMQTRYEALKNKVDPHFLFNSLNTLNSLIKIDADKAQEYVQQLSYVFRYTLQNKEMIPLEEELKYTQAYCHLMQIRYGENLHIIDRIDPKYYDYYVIPLCLQTLVENAIKHNVVSTRQPLMVCFENSDHDTVSVSNPVQPKKEKEKGLGLGLSNLSERYRLMWQKEIVIKQTDEMFSVEIPLIKK